MKRRTRQIARLIYLYCCVKYMTRENGRWVQDGVLNHDNQGTQCKGTEKGMGAVFKVAK